MDAVRSAPAALITESPLCPRCGTRTGRSAQPMPLQLVARPYAARGESRRCRGCGWQGVRLGARR